MAQKMVIIAAVDSDECDAGYGVMAQNKFRSWERSMRTKIPDRFGHLYENNPSCETFSTFDEAMTHIKRCGGVLANVHAAMAY